MTSRETYSKMNVFIIGNGFDVDHKMRTRYSDFNQYLISRFPKLNREVLYVPTPITAPDGEMVVDETDAASLICYLIDSTIGEDWSDFEDALGRINLFECFDDLAEVYDRHGDRNLWHEAYNNEDRASDLAIAIPIVKELFTDWINTVELPAQRKRTFSELIDPENDLFITFNYTHTLERLYGCKNVVHLHGELGKEIIVGHNGDLDYSENNKHVPIGCFNTLEYIYEGLRKNTSAVIEKHLCDFARVANCERVYSYGFSYSAADMPYVKTIVEHLPMRNTIWYFTDYDAQDKEKLNNYKKTIQRYGFKGAFSVFNIR